jgi:hypothetical protein
MTKLKTKWEEQKMLFVAHKVADPLFESFDQLFTDDDIAEEIVRERFKQLYHNLNHKICANLRVQSENLEEWINRLTDAAEKEINRLSFEFHYEHAPTANRTLCTEAELDMVIKEVLINALKYASSQATIEIQPSGILIKNDAAFDRQKWDQSPRALDTRRVCDDYNLAFELSSNEPGMVHADISWGPLRQTDLPVNAQTIVEGGIY